MADNKKQRYDREEKLLQLQNSTTLLAILASKVDLSADLKKLGEEQQQKVAGDQSLPVNQGDM